MFVQVVNNKIGWQHQQSDWSLFIISLISHNIQVTNLYSFGLMSLVAPTLACKNIFQTIVARQFGCNVIVKYEDDSKNSDTFQSHVALISTTDDSIIYECQPGGVCNTKKMAHVSAVEVAMNELDQNALEKIADEKGITRTGKAVKVDTDSPAPTKDWKGDLINQVLKKYKNYIVISYESDQNQTTGEFIATLFLSHKDLNDKFYSVIGDSKQTKKAAEKSAAEKCFIDLDDKDWNLLTPSEMETIFPPKIFIVQTSSKIIVKTNVIENSMHVDSAIEVGKDNSELLSKDWKGYLSTKIVKRYKTFVDITYQQQEPPSPDLFLVKVTLSYSMNKDLIYSFDGDVCTTKKGAEKSAAYKACTSLEMKGWTLPVPTMLTSIVT